MAFANADLAPAVSHGSFDILIRLYSYCVFFEVNSYISIVCRWARRNHCSVNSIQTQAAVAAVLRRCRSKKTRFFLIKIFKTSICCYNSVILAIFGLPLFINEMGVDAHKRPINLEAFSL